jgi:hypothetical protein
LCRFQTEELAYRDEIARGAKPTEVMQSLELVQNEITRLHLETLASLDYSPRNEGILYFFFYSQLCMANLRFGVNFLSLKISRLLFFSKLPFF